MTKRIQILITVCIFSGLPGSAELSTRILKAGNPEVPGVIVRHEPASSGVFVGAPSILVLPDGTYVVSLNYTSIQGGDLGKVHKTGIYASGDRGLTWTFLTEIDHQRWSTLFYHNRALYLIGGYKAFGNIVIRKSTDAGKTWTEPADPAHGLLAEGRFHCAPVPVVVHDGRIWRAMEEAPRGREFRSFMMSAPVDSDLMHAESWAFTNKVPYDRDWFDGKMRSWLEGNAVITPDGGMVNVLRCEFTSGVSDTAAMVQVNREGTRASFDPDEGFFCFPGGSKKFTIRYDPESGKYWSLVNWIQPVDRGYLKQYQAPRIRNTVALTSSSDLRHWVIERIILYHPDIDKHAFQYLDWQFDGKDIIAVSRTAYDDASGGADSYHNANYITFHRIPDFRKNFNADPPW